MASAAFLLPACLMQYCGDGGACEKASDFAHRCSCRDGYSNLLNDTSYPCYRQCRQLDPLTLIAAA
jgi:hypothetical protein